MIQELLASAHAYELAEDRARFRKFTSGMDWPGTCQRPKSRLCACAGPDRRRRGRGTAQVKLSPLVDLVTVDISSADSKNVAVSEVKAEPVVYAQKYGGKVSARLSNFGPDEVE